MKLFSFLNRSSDALGRLVPYGLPTRHLRAWGEFMRTADDRELFRVNPLYLAEQLGWSEQQILDMLTVSTAESLWNLEWDAYCAACGHMMQNVLELKELHAHQRCEMCGGESDINLDHETGILFIEILSLVCFYL